MENINTELIDDDIPQPTYQAQLGGHLANARIRDLSHPTIAER